jgi:hypothetical protein
MPRVVEVRQFLTREECGELVEAFDVMHPKYGASIPPGFHQAALHYSSIPFPSGSMDEHGRFHAYPSSEGRIRLLLHRLRTTIPKACRDRTTLYPELTILVKTPVGVDMALHKDRPWRQATAVVYLNEGFEGGLTVFADGLEIRPEVGKLVYFAGSLHAHRVTPVGVNPRYNVSLWWTEALDRLET